MTDPRIEALDRAIAEAEARIGEVRLHIEMLRGMQVDTGPAQATLRRLLDEQTNRRGRREELLSGKDRD